MSTNQPSFSYRRQIDFHEVGGNGSLQDHHAIRIINESIQEYLRWLDAPLPPLPGQPRWQTLSFQVSIVPPVTFDRFLMLTIRPVVIEGSTISFFVEGMFEESRLVCLTGETRWQQVDQSGEPMQVADTLKQKLLNSGLQVRL